MKLDVKLTKSLGQFNFAADFVIEGKRIGIFGPSGCGKSTLGNLLAGLVVADDGAIKLNDRPLYDSNDKINLPPEQRRVAVVFQHAHLFPHLNVKQNLLYGFKRTSVERQKLNIDDVVTALDISHLINNRIAGLSGGEKQRVALGRALLACPDLLILDEPLSALDSNLKGQIIPYLRKTLRRFEIPYLYISHSLNEMRLLTDQIIHLSSGQINEITNAETLAERRIEIDQSAYINHLQLHKPREVGSLLGYNWGENELLLLDHAQPESGLFALSSKEVMLFKKHPYALSARNLLTATITDIIGQGGMVSVKLNCGGEKLVVQVVREAALELGMEVGMQVYAAIKASAFKRLE